MGGAGNVHLHIDRRIVVQRYFGLQRVLIDQRLDEYVADPDRRHGDEIDVLPKTGHLLSPKGAGLVRAASILAAHIKKLGLADAYENLIGRAVLHEIGHVEIERKEDVE